MPSNGNSPARLDRIMLHPRLSPALAGCTTSLYALECHRAVVAVLRPRAAPPEPPPRVRLPFATHADLAGQLKAWVTAEAAPLVPLGTAAPADLLAAWPPFKDRLKAEIGRLNASTRRRWWRWSARRISVSRFDTYRH